MCLKLLYLSLVLILVIRGSFGRFYFCNDPGTPDNAIRMTQFGVVYKYYIGSTIEYDCSPGYVLRGASTITCNLLITSPFVVVGWKPADLPQCIKGNTSVVCPQLASPRNGRVSVSGRTVEDNATYSCRVGFKLTGSAERECQQDGKWSGIEPVCSSVDCGAPEDFANGMITMTSTLYRAVITYSCDYGYILIGVQTRRCQENGRWSGPSPICEVMDCGSPGFPRNGDTIVGGTTYNSTVTHVCNEGYILIGDKQRSCHGNGTWSGVFPKCEPISCGNVSIPQNGSANTTDTVLGTVVYFTCNEGYGLVGSASIECQKNAQWSGIFPLCFLIKTDCGDPGTPQHGVKFYTNTTVGSVISFSCLTGYMLLGPKSIQCNNNGVWSDVLPQCLLIDCGDPGEPTFGERQLKNTTFRSTVSYTCVNSSYRLEGVTTRRCLVNGSWSGHLPSCVLINCRPPESPTFGGVNFSNSTTGSLATYSCQEGYRLVGVAQRICLDNETWSGVVPLCVAITDCGSPDIPVFGVRLNNNFSVGAVVVYDCIIGYTLIGPTTRTCLVNGTWSGLSPKCKFMDCGDPGTPNNGSRILNGTGLLSTVEYTCNDGFVLIGSDIRVCQSDNMWSGDIPECELVDCGNPGIPNPGGVVFVSNTTAGSSVLYTCLVGFDILGEPERVCLNNGTWSGSIPTCVNSNTTAIADCGFPEVPLLGAANFDDITIGSVAMYSCVEGYMLLGNQNRTCLPNGEWSGGTPVCVSI